MWLKSANSNTGSLDQPYVLITTSPHSTSATPWPNPPYIRLVLSDLQVRRFHQYVESSFLQHEQSADCLQFLRAYRGQKDSLGLRRICIPGCHRMLGLRPVRVRRKKPCSASRKKPNFDKRKEPKLPELYLLFRVIQAVPLLERSLFF